MKRLPTGTGLALALLALAVPVLAAPVHVALKPAATVRPDAEGFFTLGAVADLTGDSAGRMSGVRVGRAPLPGATRLLTRGDVALKLRQAGFNPETQAVIEGAVPTTVTTEAAPSVATDAAGSTPRSVPPPGDAKPEPRVILVHRGDAVTVVVQEDGVQVTARAVARENGAAGETIRVHREGVMTDLSVVVLDAQTVQLEN